MVLLVCVRLNLDDIHQPAHDAAPADVNAIHPNPPGVVSISQGNRPNPQRVQPQLPQMARLFEIPTTSTSATEDHVNPIFPRPHVDRSRKIDSASKMIFISTIIFAVTWLPAQVMRFFSQPMTMPIRKTDPFAFSVVILAQLFGLLNHAIDPILYSFVNMKFRIQCAKLICRLKDLR